MDTPKMFWKQMSLYGNIWQWINSIRKIRRWNWVTKFIQIALLDILTWLHRRPRSQIIKDIQLPFPSVIVFDSILMMPICKGNIFPPLASIPFPSTLGSNFMTAGETFVPARKFKINEKDRKTNSISRKGKA